MPSRKTSASSRIALIVTLSFAALVATAMWLSAASPQAQTKDPGIERGHKQFLESCAFCHGPDATGGRGPDLLRSGLVAHDVKGDKIGEVVRNGRPDKGMPPLPMTDQQITELASYLHDRAAEVLESSGVPDAYPIEKLLTGNAAEGEKYFEEAGGCKNCHSVTGDLAGVSKKYNPIDLEARMLYPEGKPRTAVVTLHSGQQYSGPVRHVDDFIIILRNTNDGQFHSFNRDQVKLELHDPLSAHLQLLGKMTQTDMHNLFAYITSLK